MSSRAPKPTQASANANTASSINVPTSFVAIGARIADMRVSSQRTRPVSGAANRVPYARASRADRGGRTYRMISCGQVTYGRKSGVGSFGIGGYENAPTSVQVRAFSTSTEKANVPTTTTAVTTPETNPRTSSDSG